MTPTNTDPNRRSAGSLSDDNGNGTTKQKLEQDARDAKSAVGEEAREKAEAGQHRLAEEAGALSDAIDAAASKLDDQDREGLARYAREVSINLSTAAEHIEGRSVDELADDAKRLARNNPALFMFGSIAVGFGLSRFFKASAEHEQHEEGSEHRAATHSKGSSFADDKVPAGEQMRRREREKTGSFTSSNGSEML